MMHVALRDIVDVSTPLFSCSMAKGVDSSPLKTSSLKVSRPMVVYSSQRRYRGCRQTGSSGGGTFPLTT